MAFWQYVTGVVTPGASGNAFTVTVISALGLSQPIVWLTQYEVFPGVAVDGVGAVALPVPPVAVVYHNNPVPVAVSGTAVAFWQYVTGVVTPGASGKAFTVTVICALGLSQPIVWLTQYEVFPGVAVDGVGAVALPVPPVAVVYHNNPVPVAVSGTAVAFWQYVTGVVTPGASGNAFTVTAICALGLSQPIVWLTQYEVFPGVAVDGVGAVALPVPPVAVVYHNNPVPVAVSGTAVAFWQYVTGVVTPGASGKAFTVTVISALGLSQPIVWLTQYEVFPGVAVDGVGAVALPVPPVAVVYHNNPVPVAVSGTAVAFWQYVTGVVTPGASGIVFTVTTISVLGLSQPIVWLTQYEVFPGVAVDGVGAVALPVPPVAVVYHNNPVPVAVSGTAVAFWQYVTGVVTPGASGNAFTVTDICALGLSQPIVWLTQYEVFPGVAVDGVGAVALPVPPVAVVYHNNPVPVAVSGTAVAFWQYVTGVVTPGASGNAFTVTVISALGLSQPIVWLTQYEVFPGVAVDGVGAVALPVPPVAVVYHNNPAPVAVSGTAVAF